MSFGWILLVTAVWWAACIGAYFVWAHRHIARTAGELEAAAGK